MFRLHSVHTCAIVVTGVLHSVRSELPHQWNTQQRYNNIEYSTRVRQFSDLLTEGEARGQ